MASSKPIIATKIDGVKEALGQDYEYLVEIGDHQSFFMLLKKLVESASIAEELGKKNHARICKEFPIEQLSKNTLHFIESVIR